MPVQNLLPQDFLARLQFCQFLRQCLNIDPDFYSKILFTVEAIFTRGGVFNWRNSHTYDTKNLRNFQHEFSVKFSMEKVPTNLEDVTLNLRLDYWFMHDGAPSYYSVSVRNYLNLIYPNKWIGRGSEHPWPARIPDLNPSDFSYWGHLKLLVYKSQINARQDCGRR